ncbi:MAG: MarR family winged helix-turn-helix transcriptional regulator [Lachnospiraceae bacterium]
MDNHFPNLGRCISILDRLMKMYYDHGLSDFEIGWGQQFYAEYIYDHPGTTAQEMVECIRVDKATLTKSIKKLVDIGYVEVVNDEKDKRVKLLYPTQKGKPAVKRIKEIHHDFYDILCSGISPQDIQLSEQTMEQMMENINQKVWHRMEEHHGTE